MRRARPDPPRRAARSGSASRRRPASASALTITPPPRCGDPQRQRRFARGGRPGDQHRPVGGEAQRSGLRAGMTSAALAACSACGSHLGCQAALNPAPFSDILPADKRWRQSARRTGNGRLPDKTTYQPRDAQDLGRGADGRPGLRPASADGRADRARGEIGARSGRRDLHGDRRRQHLSRACRARRRGWSGPPPITWACWPR